MSKLYLELNRNTTKQIICNNEADVKNWLSHRAKRNEIHKGG